MLNNLSQKIEEYSKISAYRRNFRFLNVKEKINVLDIGAGSCLLRKIFSDNIKKYVAFEPKHYSSHELYLKKNDILIKDYFPLDFGEKEHFDYIFALTVVDEIKSKSTFLQAIKMHANRNTRIFIAVRNLDFPLRKNVYVTGSSGEVIQDLSIADWRKLFSDYEIVAERTFIRPLLNEKISTTMKLAIIRIIDWIMPTCKSYMVLFELKISNV